MRFAKLYIDFNDFLLLSAGYSGNVTWENASVEVCLSDIAERQWSIGRGPSFLTELSVRHRHTQQILQLKQFCFQLVFGLVITLEYRPFLKNHTKHLTYWLREQMEQHTLKNGKENSHYAPRWKLILSSNPNQCAPDILDF